jgi:hypothetical protein
MFHAFFGSKQKPWTAGESILEQIKRWDGINALRLVEPPLAGLSDGADAGAVDRCDEARLVTEFLELIRLLMMNGNEQARGALYEAAVRYPVASLLDMILHEIHRQSWWRADKIRPHARWFVTQSRHVEPLRFGIALLALSGEDADLRVLRELARHDDFTIAAANAVATITDDPIEEWWQMAQAVSGWSKVHLVKRLARRCDKRSDMQAWLLRQGWRRCVSPEYVAYCCANAGKLDQALATNEPDEALMEGTCVLIGGMLSAGPAEHLEDYEGGVGSILHWLQHLRRGAVDPSAKKTLNRVREWVLQEEQPQVWERRAEQLGWTEEMRQRIADECALLAGDQV